MKTLLFLILVQLSSFAASCSERYTQLFQEAMTSLELNTSTVQLLRAQKNPLGAGMYITHGADITPTRLDTWSRTIYLSEDYCATLDDKTVKVLLIDYIKKLTKKNQ